ncbi:uncharacterized protein K02A2.6-like [Ochlerotatus camptorhynchus]|uniref:uncharacterized protein K02A2.6-like n=1 Tax=Ochlerotatus camptorhynchus TaxID=644619 RepID=UPI0031D9F5E1
MAEECNRIINLKQDTKMIEKGCLDRSQQSRTCVNCKRKGHKEGYCSSSEKKPAKKVDKPKPKDFVNEEPKVTLYRRPDSRPAHCLKRPIAYAALPKVDAELQRLQDNGIISPVKFSDWVAPIVVVRKSDVSVRICGDYSTGLNVPSSQIAYLQVEVEEASRKLLTINTHKGLFQYNRLPPRVKSAPGAFQRIIDSMVAGSLGVKLYLDDLLIDGKTQQDHDRSLNAVLDRIREYGFHLRIEKCRFSLPQIKFLGHIIDKDGLRQDPAKTNAISQMPPPMNVSQL